MSSDGFSHIPDTLEAVPLPFQQKHLFGHNEGLGAFLHAFRGGRLHHAWLVTGAPGIGKSTFSYHCTRYLLSETAEQADPDHLREKTPLNGALEQDAHPNVMTLRRVLNRTGKAFATRITVETVRKANQFFETTAANDGWRIIIVDPAEEMNVQAANALLKTLEEPPKDAIFFLISHRPGALLPTIRSRCRHLPLHDLGDDDVFSVLRTFSNESDDVLRKAAGLGQGSVRRALTFASADAIALREAVIRATGKSDPPFFEKSAVFNAINGYGDGGFRLFSDILTAQLEERTRQVSGADLPQANRCAGNWTRIREIVQQTEIYNLDKRDAVFALLELAAE